MVAQGNIAATTKIKPLYLLSGINLTPIKYTDTLAYASSAVFAAHDCAQHTVKHPIHYNGSEAPKTAPTSGGSVHAPI